ncbi:MAG: hypothetical protein A2898_01745 [Candidatus Kerfeldbacteria bacterium RIFCSPLOWO2_01_FULL_48_11]|uniref:DUF4870 domain-containing protein n=1 Tax=Candidatus Kerfeldbacteria bacterium RIFCSPLOWO2_01_FULL_48_11 TaxID=1798543 RepID=A0A1G2B491_9BACT|nr:MAG: hypothetical protein UY34_C0010G0094 [Parcubacteria group bacterium GW2011_GWA2_48_9]KKW16556.1 MAG: hypothetical protein UY52_C0003G0052 [Parcubacteria group bacterium GW2011_GWC2_49_9]OGY83978.1 MAG: hypothetical protein A2898_01745 [Candidatus Kerfeldbacteria bacterium RIFCSPLOWO2_01_FULL_48_11]HCJ52638.1 hypothetical protein [Candidatus Kerfeldbacteria bacterium]HCM68316.1 hypothetical protein [Candidatus Kerfeldbacteria bacterium]
MDEQKMPQQEQLTSERKLMAALSYVWGISLIMLILKKDDPYIRFHARQGFVIFLLWFLVFIWFIALFVWAVIVLLSLLGFFKALSGERYRIPIIADIAEKVVQKLNL